jgi:hypothetical protein
LKNENVLDLFQVPKEMNVCVVTEKDNKNIPIEEKSNDATMKPSMNFVFGKPKSR